MTKSAPDATPPKRPSDTGTADAGGIVVRRSTASEWKALRNLRLRALESDPLAFGSTLAEEKQFEEARWKERARQGAESVSTSQWVAESPDGNLAGSVVIAKVQGKVFVFAMWVEPRLRGHGVGARLLDVGLAWADSMFPGEPIYLDVNPRQVSAVGLYESRGFRRAAADRPLGHTSGESRYEMILENPSARVGRR